MTCQCQRPQLPDPNQRDMFVQVETILDYERGFDTGTKWDANWKPGGPDIYRNTHDRYHPRYREFVMMEEQSKARYTAWHDGFRDGLAIRLQDAKFAAWYATHSKMRGYFKYHGDDN